MQKIEFCEDCVVLLHHGRTETEITAVTGTVLSVETITEQDGIAEFRILESAWQFAKGDKLSKVPLTSILRMRSADNQITFNGDLLASNWCKDPESNLKAQSGKIVVTQKKCGLEMQINVGDLEKGLTIKLPHAIGAAVMSETMSYMRERKRRNRNRKKISAA